jgi:hypothetical protein
VLFRDLLTQWTVAPVGIVGLRYEAVQVVMDLHAVPPSQRLFAFHGLRVMEAAALAILNDS